MASLGNLRHSRHRVMSRSGSGSGGVRGGATGLRTLIKLLAFWV